MNKTLLIFLFLSLSGCATSSYNYTARNYQSTPLSKPEIGVVNTISVGEVMLEQGMIVEKDVLVVPSDLKIEKHLVITAGQYEKLGSRMGVDTYLGNSSFSPNGGYVARRGNIDPLFNISLNLDTGKICVTSPIGASKCLKKSDAYVKKVQVPVKDSFQQTLIYSGKVGNKINIGYREFSSNLARPAFNNDVEYDLSESRQIGYKGALLEIQDANNQSITYRVIRNFN